LKHVVVNMTLPDKETEKTNVKPT